MNIYLISQNENTGYDTFSDAVVIAKCADDAAKIHPVLDWEHDDDSKTVWNDGIDDSWCSSPEQVRVELIGQAKPDAVEGIVLTSFHAE